jgi:hypothetical protein
MKQFLLALVALFAFGVSPAFAERAVVRGLDKVTGHARDYSLPIGRAVRIGSLEVTARSCRKAAPEDPPEVQIYVEVYDHPAVPEGQESTRTELFHGWLFASSPGLSALEHPVWDIWAIDCRA